MANPPKKRKDGKADLEAILAEQIRQVRMAVGGSPILEPTREHRFHPVRKWRFDFAWPARLIAMEVEGLTRGGGPPEGACKTCYGRCTVAHGGSARRVCPTCKGRGTTGGGGLGRHQRIEGFEEDCIKYNSAWLLGWGVLRATGKMVHDGRALAVLEEAFGDGMAWHPPSATVTVNE